MIACPSPSLDVELLFCRNVTRRYSGLAWIMSDHRPNLFYTVAEVAVFFRVSSRTVRRWVKASILHRIAVPGRLTRISAEEVMELAKSFKKKEDDQS